MAGEWHGGYANPSTGGSGAIRISIPREEHGAYGEIVMSGAGRPLRSMSEAGPGPRPDPASIAAEPLFIRFVRVSGATVTGALEPYQDPECGCIVSTTFTGTLSGDVLEGTWVSNGGTFHATQYGTWRVTRERPR